MAVSTKRGAKNGLAFSPEQAAEIGKYARRHRVGRAQIIKAMFESFELMEDSARASLNKVIFVNEDAIYQIPEGGVGVDNPVAEMRSDRRRANR